MFQRCVALKIFVANRLCNIALKRETFQLRLSQFQDCPSSPPPPLPDICRAFVILLVPVVGVCQKTSGRGWGICELPI